MLTDSFLRPLQAVAWRKTFAVTLLLVLSACVLWSQAPPVTPPAGFVRVAASATELVEGATSVPMEVRTAPFWIAQNELSQEEFERVMGTKASVAKAAQSPAVNVSWNDAIAYCNRRSDMEKLSRCYGENGEWNRQCTGYCLPTEAEWLAAIGNPTPVPEAVLQQSNLYREGNTIAALRERAGQSPSAVHLGPTMGAGVRNAFGYVWE